jgi:hypothetical protein
MARARPTASFATLTEEGQAQAMARFAVLRDRTLRMASPWRARPTPPACRCERRSAGSPVTAGTGWQVSRALAAAMPVRVARLTISSR